MKINHPKEKKTYFCSVNLMFVLFFYFNLSDELLDDLHTTVTRTAEHLDSAKARDVQYLSPKNTTTVVKERSVSPATVSI